MSNNNLPPAYNAISTIQDAVNNSSKPISDEKFELLMERIKTIEKKLNIYPAKTAQCLNPECKQWPKINHEYIEAEFAKRGFKTIKYSNNNICVIHSDLKFKNCIKFEPIFADKCGSCGNDIRYAHKNYFVNGDKYRWKIYINKFDGLVEDLCDEDFAIKNTKVRITHIYDNKGYTYNYDNPYKESRYSIYKFLENLVKHGKKIEARREKEGKKSIFSSIFA